MVSSKLANLGERKTTNLAVPLHSHSSAGTNTAPVEIKRTRLDFLRGGRNAAEIARFSPVTASLSCQPPPARR